jgi:uncharacterized membrane protein
LSDFLRWAVLTLVLSGAMFLLFLWRTPFFITKVVLRGFGRRLGGPPWNRLRPGTVMSSGDDSVVMTSPDMIYMFGAFEVSKEPVVIHCAVPDHDTYWCVSLYAKNTDNFYVRNDRDAAGRDFDLVIASARSDYRKTGGEEVAVAPTDRGVIVVRAVVKDREDEVEVARIQEFLKQTTIAPWSEVRDEKVRTI